VALRVVGAGLGRTGTNSLMVALEELLGAPCYHMHYVFQRDDAAKWLAIGRCAGETQSDVLDDVLAGCAAAVDWPASAYWEPLAAANPAVILLSTRASGEAWFKSASDTIFPTINGIPAGPWRDMVHELFANTFTADYLDKDKAIAAYEAHNAYVRATADPTRLLDWQAADGWGPICDALKLPVPETEFPHTNSTEEFLARFN
jgi:hypothetical protein